MTAEIKPLHGTEKVVLNVVKFRTTRKNLYNRLYDLFFLNIWLLLDPVDDDIITLIIKSEDLKLVKEVMDK